MKNKRILFIALAAIPLVLLLIYSINIPEAEACCEGGRCTGSAYCSACKNCKYCAHCNAGGSCGVCYSPPPKKEKPAAKTKEEKKSGSNTPVTAGSEEFAAAGDIYIVNTETLNLRTGPDKGYTIITTLKQGDKVKIISGHSSQWVKVQTIVSNNQQEPPTGYVYMQHLKKEKK
jgi:uncharacterized protein YgiM (DUF1202 family)